MSFPCKRESNLSSQYGSHFEGKWFTFIWQHTENKKCLFCLIYQTITGIFKLLISIKTSINTTNFAVSVEISI